MYEFQDVGVEWLRAHPRAMLGDDPGMGKTRQLLLAAEGRTLVVAPAMIHDAGVWVGERDKWRPDLDITCVSYSSLSARDGRKVLPEPRKEYREHWDTVIFDEAHYLKSRDSMRTRTALKLKSDRFWLATGTPIPNWAHELYVPLRFMWGKDDKRYTSYWRWVEDWFSTWKPSWGGTKIESLRGCNCQEQNCRHWVEFARENLGDRFLRREREAGMLPPLTEQHWTLPARKEQARVYAELKESYIAWVGENNQEVSAWSEGELFGLLARVAVGLELVTDTRSSAKMDHCLELLADRAHLATLVLTHHRATATGLAARLKEANIGCEVVNGETPRSARGTLVQRFQAGEVPVLVGGLDVISEGLTLTAADAAIFVEHAWRPSTNEQAMRRIHRIGQTKPVTVHHLWTADTVDSAIRGLLQEKTDHQIRALTAAQFAALL